MIMIIKKGWNMFRFILSQLKERKHNSPAIPQKVARVKKCEKVSQQIENHNKYITFV